MKTTCCESTPKCKGCPCRPNLLGASIVPEDLEVSQLVKKAKATHVLLDSLIFGNILGDRKDSYYNELVYAASRIKTLLEAIEGDTYDN